MRLIARFLGIISALDFLRALQALRATVAANAPEGASQQEAIRLTKDNPEVQSARKKLMRELVYWVFYEALIILGLIIWIFK